MAAVTTERDLDGSTVAYEEISVAGDHVERLLTELFTEHWSRITVGPIIQGAAWEIRFMEPPRISMLDGYLTVDPGAGHFHLCVNDTSGPPALAGTRRVARAAFFQTTGGSCTPVSYGLRLWNGRGEQMVTVFFPNPHYDDEGRPLRPPDPSRVELWDTFRRRYAAE